MIPVPPDRVRELLVRDSDQVLTNVSGKYAINGFAYVFEVGQPEPCFYLAINTTNNGLADPSTGEWDFPAGFQGDGMSAEWHDCYRKLDTYMMEDDDLEPKVREVEAVFCSAMKEIRKRWQTRLEDCVFTVNECNDSAQSVREIYEDINETRA